MKSCLTCLYHGKYHGCNIGWCVNYDRYEQKEPIIYTPNVPEKLLKEVDFFKEEDFKI